MLHGAGLPVLGLGWVVKNVVGLGRVSDPCPSVAEMTMGHTF